MLALFQTIGSLGEAKGLFAHAEAVATTALVLIIATTIMSSWLFAGAWLVQASYLNSLAVAHMPSHGSKEDDVESLRSRDFPHQWLPEKVELKSWEQIEPWYQKLMDQPIETRPRSRALGGRGRRVECGRRRGRGQALRRDDLSDRRPGARGGLSGLSSVTSSPSSSRSRTRSGAAISIRPSRSELPRDRYFVFDRALENRRSLFREANIPRETQLAELEQQYQKIIGAMTVTFRGQERTLAQMAPFLEETDRSVRQEAWELAADRRLEDREALDDLFDQMKQLRIEIAREAGFANFVEYAFRNRERFDYGIADTVRFHEAVEHVVVPLTRQIQEKHRRALGVETLRPWDLAVDPLGRPPLAAFQGRRTARRRHRDHLSRRRTPSWANSSPFSASQQLLDLANRKGKAPGGYQTTLEDARLPFIFMNAVGLDSDVRTLLHEGGHAFHTLACRGEPLSAYRESPLEFCEVASMTMELLGARRLDPFYNARRRRPVQPQAARGDRADPALDRHGRRLSALDLHPPRPYPRTSARPPGEDLLDRFGGSSIGPATKRLATIPGIASSIFSCIRFIISNTGSPSSGPCRSGSAP